VRPVLVHLPFGLPLYGYGAMLCLAVVLGRLLALHLAERDGLDRAQLSRAVLWSLAFAFVGGRLLYVVTNLDHFHQPLDAFKWWQGGMVAYGGFLGGFLGAIVFCRLHGIRLLAWADCAAPALCVGLAVTRIGCFLGGCDFGRPWDGAWAVRFPAGSPAFQQQTLLALLPAGATESLPVHPTQLYESLAGLVLLGLVLLVRARRKAAGQVFAAFVIGYSVLRYAIETVRADSDRGSVGPFSTSQFIAVVTLGAAVALAIALQRRSPAPAPRPASARS
jgi:phosphatidylglycerol---prolipoprotein diacylglyceryl transferase